MLDVRTPVATIVLDHSECAPVLARHRIDYCCAGDRALADACKELGLDVASVASELETAIDCRHARELDPRTLSMRELIDRAIVPHHEYLHRTMPFLQTLAGNVVRVHGAREPALHEVARLVDLLVETMAEHLADEESLLFPALAEGHPQDVRAMLLDQRPEHALITALLAELRRAAADYRAPVWACNSYRTLMTELAVLEADTLAHIELEDDALLSRFS